MQHPMANRLPPTRWVIGVGLGLSCLALAGCSGSTSAPATSTPVAPQSAKAMIAEAKAAMTSEGWVRAHGSSTTSGPGGGRATITETDVSGPTSGTQSVTVTVTQHGVSQVLRASVVVVDGRLYMNANAGFWTNSGDLSANQAATVADRWIEVPTSSAIYAQAVTHLTMPSLVSDIFDAGTFEKGKVVVVKGVPGVRISYDNRGADPGRAVSVLAIAGHHLPISLDLGGENLQLGSWGKSTTVAVPAGSVPLASVLPSVADSGEATT
jgi:hypothetical protein